MEEWKQVEIPGLEDYRVSNYGRVKVMRRLSKDGRELPTKYLSIYKEHNSPCVRMRTRDGVMIKRNLGKLVLNHFSEIKHWGTEYQAAPLDGNLFNTHIDNLVWIAQEDVLRRVGRSTKGKLRPDLNKYQNIVIYCNGYIVGFFKNTTEAQKYMDNNKFITKYRKSMQDSLRDSSKWFFVFNLKEVSDEEYLKISKENKMENLPLIMNILIKDRETRMMLKKVPEIVFKEKEVIKHKVEVQKQVVYREIKPKVTKPKVKKTKEQVAVRPKVVEEVEPTKEDIEEIELQKVEEIKREQFRREILKRL